MSVDGVRRIEVTEPESPVFGGAEFGAVGHACRVVAARERLRRGRPVHHSRFDNPVRADGSRAAAGGRSAALARIPLRVA
jgi:hypothetical protein